MAVDNALSFADDLEHNARWYGAELAYVQDGRTLTHSQLLQRAKRLGSALYHSGLRKQDRVAILAMNGIEFGEVIAASQYAGYVLSTLNFRLAGPEVVGIVNDSQPRVLLFDQCYTELVASIKDELPGIELYVCIGGGCDFAIDYECYLQTGEESGPPLRATADDLFCLIYTSGTTGKPKGCVWGQREMRGLAQIMAWLSGIEQPDKVLLVMPMFHIGALAVGLSLHVRGATVHLARQFEPVEALRTIGREGISLLHLAPTMLQMLLESDELARTDVSNVRTCIYSAAPMPLAVLRRAIEVFGGCNFTNLYGQTEVCSFGLSPREHKPYGNEREQARLMSVGKPWPNTLARTVDEHGQDCPMDVAGEIIIKSAVRFRGYWNNDVATQETIRDGWVYTGDVGRIDQDGFLYLVDRKKDVIISGGENIYSREIEEAVLSHPAVSECAVIGLRDARWGESVCAVVTLLSGHSLDEAQLIEHVRTRIASYKKPKRVVFVEQLPKMVTGKVNKVELRAMFDRAEVLVEAGVE